jgi:predicted chitinase
MHFLIFCLLAGLLAVPASVAQTKVTASPPDWARIQDFAGKLAGGYDRLEKKMDEFSSRTGLDIYIVTAYPHNQPDISRLAAEWPQMGKGLLLGLNLHGEENWTQHLRIAYTPEVTGKLPAEKIVQVRDLVLLPLLEGKEIAVADEFGGTRWVSFAGQGKYYLTLEQGIDALLAAYAGTPFGSVPTLAFTGSPAARYGFDAKKYDALASRYGRGLDELTGKETFTPWKALATGKPDVVAVTAMAKSSQAELAKVAIKAPDGSALPTPVLHDGQLQVTLPGGAFEGPEEMEAYYPTGDKDGYVLGRLNVVRYPSLRKKVVVVPLPGTQNVPSAAQLRDLLNRIYGQAVVEWEVTLETTFDPWAWDGNGDGKIETGHSGLLSNYPEEMRAINKAFRNRYNAYEADAYYVFLAGEAESAGTLGYMPRAKQFGYAFTRFQTPAGVARTVAHELGHGAFHLKHTFDETGLARGTSDNLMDYRNGTRLHKYQWDLVHDPVRVIGLLEEDEEGALALPCWGLFDDCDDVLKQLAAIKSARERGQTVTVISPPNGAKRVWTASNIKIENTEYEEIRVVCEGPEDSKIAVDPSKYEAYSQTFLTSEGQSDVQEGFVLKNDKGILAKILIIENYGLLEEKKEALKAYLFGANVQDTITKTNVAVTPMQFESVKKDKEIGDSLKCTVCGKNLLLSYEELKELFPSSKIIRDNPQIVVAFNEALVKGKLNTCNRIAHILAQIHHESQGLNSAAEDLNYSLKAILDTFSGTYTAKPFFKQSFWDNKDYLKYAVAKVYEQVDTVKGEKGGYGSGSLTTFYYSRKNTKIDTIRIPTVFPAQKKGIYKKLNYTNAEKQVRIENWVNQVYSKKDLGNGDPASGDGYKYRGRGAIQLTGRYNYRMASTKCNKVFGTSFDWEKNPDQVANDPRSIVLSAFSYVLANFPDLTLLDGSDVAKVTVKINSKKLGLLERTSKYNSFKNGHYKCISLKQK